MKHVFAVKFKRILGNTNNMVKGKSAVKDCQSISGTTRLPEEFHVCGILEVWIGEMKIFLGHVGCQIRHMFKKEDEGIVKLGCQVGGLAVMVELVVGHGLERGQGQDQGQG